MSSHPAHGSVALRSQIDFGPSELRAAALALKDREFRSTQAAWVPPGPAIAVQAVHGGAGATTAALLIGMAASRLRPVWLVDLAAPASSGLVGVATIEHGAGGGWVRGALQARPDRGGGDEAQQFSITVDRLASPVFSPAQVPLPRADVPQIPELLTVMDVGWLPRELSSYGRSWISSLPHSGRNKDSSVLSVLVARAQPRGLASIELALSAHHRRTPQSRPLVVLTGAGRWSRRLEYLAGPGLKAAYHDHRAAFLHGVDTTSLDAGSLSHRDQLRGRALYADCLAALDKSRRSDPIA